MGAQIQGAQTQYTIVNFGLNQSLIGSHLIGYNQEIDTTKKFLHRGFGYASWMRGLLVEVLCCVIVSQLSKEVNKIFKIFPYSPLFMSDKICCFEKFFDHWSASLLCISTKLYIGIIRLFVQIILLGKFFLTYF